MNLDCLDLFSAAAGGWTLGMERAGFRTIAACESIEWRRILYAENNPGVLIYDDVCTLTADRIRSDLGTFPPFVFGSPPCQDISAANTKGRGVEGERSILFFQAVRIIGEGRPRWFALENSANLRTRGADSVIAPLEALGYTCWTFVVGAEDVGANHERKRAWIIGCDVSQLANTYEAGQVFRQLVASLGGSGSASHDTPDGLGVEEPPIDAPGKRHEGRRARRHGTHGDGSSSVAGGDASDPYSDALRLAELPQRPNPEASKPRDPDKSRDASYANQARQAHGRMEPSLRQAEISVDGCGVGRGDDQSSARQVVLRTPDRAGAIGSRVNWTLNDLAARLRMDDGLPAWVAGQRVKVGGSRGTNAAGLLVEAYGDAVCPQIPEAIGRAILRVERAYASIYGAPNHDLG